MPLLNNVVGLDLGSHSLKGVEFRQSLRGFEVVALRILPRANSEAPLHELVQHFMKMHRLSADHVVTALPGGRLSSRRFQFPFRDRKKVAQAVPFEVAEDSLFDLDDVLIDWEIVGGDRNHAEVVATIAPRTEVSNRIEMLREADCEPRNVEAEGLVLGNLSALFDLPGTQLLIDLGHAKTTCCLIADGMPISARTFPIAGAAITAALSRDRGVSTEEAERIKCESGVFGTSLSDLPPETGAVLDRLAREIVRTITSLEAVTGGLDSGPISRATLIGGTAQLQQLDAYLSEQIGVPAAPLGLPIEGHGESLVSGGSLLVFAPALALAVRGTTKARTRTDFRQDEFAVRLDLGRYRKEFAWPAGLAITAGLLAAVSMGTATSLEAGRADRVEARVAQLYADVFPGKRMPPNALAALRSAVSAETERAEFLGVYRGNLSALDLLTEISRLVPESLDLVFEELNIDRQTIRMRVYAKSFEAADRLGAELEKFPPFAQARIGAIERDKKRGGMRFNVTISLAKVEASG